MLGKLSSDHRTGTGQFSFQSQRRAMQKNVQTVVLISHSGKVMLKILQARLQQYIRTGELPDVEAGLEKAEEPEIKFPTSVQFSRSVMSDSLRPHELQHARPHCPS